MTDPFLRLRSSIARGARPAVPGFDRRARGGRRAAVLLLFTRDDDPSLTFIERATTLRKHPGQMAFPGGGLEEGDATLVDAALREAQEEVGLDPRLVTVLGELPVAWVPASSYDVTPVIGTWDGGQQLRAADPAEVGSVHHFTVGQLADPANRVSGRHPGGYVGPAFSFGDVFIWGFTGHLVDWTLQLAGWQRPWDASRVVDVPARFMRD